MLRVLQLLLLAVLLAPIAACGYHPPPATTQIIQQGTVLSDAQLKYINDYKCPEGTRKSVYTEADSTIIQGRGGQPSSTVKVQCYDPAGPRPQQVLPQAEPSRQYPGSGVYYTRPRWLSRGWYDGGHPDPTYAPNGYRPVWDGKRWICRTDYGDPYGCLR